MPHTILYVDDDTAIIDLVREVLKHPDIRLLGASSGSEGMAKIYAERPDLIILDIMMPDRDGWSIYQEVRADETLRHIPIIMLTALLHRYRIMKDFANSPIDAYMTKPFNAASLRSEVEKMLGISYWSAHGG